MHWQPTLSENGNAKNTIAFGQNPYIRNNRKKLVFGST